MASRPNRQVCNTITNLLARCCTVPALPDVPEVGSLGKSPPTMGMRNIPSAPSGRSPTAAARSPPSYRGGFGGHEGGGYAGAGGPTRALPTQPPFKAFIGNLPHAVEDRDIAEIFSDMQAGYCHCPPSQTAQQSKIGDASWSLRLLLVSAAVPWQAAAIHAVHCKNCMCSVCSC